MFSPSAAVNSGDGEDEFSIFPGREDGFRLVDSGNSVPFLNCGLNRFRPGNGYGDETISRLARRFGTGRSIW